jgi:O-antigen/teichoic acid export membrane protein
MRRSEFAWVVVGQATALVGAVIGVRLLTQVLPPAAYGELALGLTGVTLAQQALFSPLSAAALRYFSTALEVGSLGAYFCSVWLLARRAIMVLLAASVAVLTVFLVLGWRSWVGLASGALVLATLAGTCSLFDGMQNAARQRAVVAWHDALTPWARFFGAVTLATVIGAEGGVAMGGFAAATALLLASQWWFYRRRLAILVRLRGHATPQDMSHWCQTLVEYGRPFVTWGLFSWAQVVSDRWALQTFASTEAVGIYAVLFQTGYYPITLLSGLMSQLAVPVLFARAGDGRDPARYCDARWLNRRLLALMGVFMIIGVVGATLLHQPLFALLVAPEYRSMSGLLPFVMIAGCLFSSGQAAALTLLSASASHRLIAPKVMTGLLGVVLNGAGAALWGVPGVVAATVVAAALYAVWVLFLAEAAKPTDVVPAAPMRPGLNE